MTYQQIQNGELQHIHTDCVCVDMAIMFSKQKIKKIISECLVHAKTNMHFSLFLVQ